MITLDLKTLKNRADTTLKFRDREAYFQLKSNTERLSKFYKQLHRNISNANISNADEQPASRI